VLSWIEVEQHPSVKPHLTPNLHGFSEGQFYAGLNEIDPEGSMGFEEWMMALRDRLSATHIHDPCYTFDRIVRDGCGRLLRHKMHTLDRLPAAYQNFASWFREHHLYGQTNAIVSFNWDLLAERTLTDARAGWLYTIESPLVPILKPHGSINWSNHVERNLAAESPAWQPIAPRSTYYYIRHDPFSDPFENGTNQFLRKLILPGDPEDAGGARLIWTEAEAAIHERDVVVFIGYSLPRYDSFSTKFFQRVTAGKQIEVYARSAETLQHYRQMLPDISTTEPLSFAQSQYARPFAEAVNA
jgi:hypothetical protein